MNLIELGLILVFIGMGLIFLGFILLMLSSLTGGKLRGGGVVFLGPLPIGLATDKEALKWVLIFSLIVLILFVLLILIA